MIGPQRVPFKTFAAISPCRRLLAKTVDTILGIIIAFSLIFPFLQSAKRSMEGVDTGGDGTWAAALVITLFFPAAVIAFVIVSLLPELKWKTTTGKFLTGLRIGKIDSAPTKKQIVSRYLLHSAWLLAGLAMVGIIFSATLIDGTFGWLGSSSTDSNAFSGIDWLEGESSWWYSALSKSITYGAYAAAGLLFVDLALVIFRSKHPSIVDLITRARVTRK